MNGALYNGTRFRVLNILDEEGREALDIVVDTSLPAARVVHVLDQHLFSCLAQVRELGMDDKLRRRAIP